MPQKTFINLAGKRKKEIINICLEEFAMNDYESTSLSGIIKRLKIAKGSFYRYFQSKKELYIYIIEYLGTIIRPCAEECFFTIKKDIIESLQEYYLALISLEREYPFYLRFLFKIRSEKNISILKDIRYKKARNKLAFIKTLLETQQKMGNIRKDVDLTLLVILFRQMFTILFDYLSEKYQLDLGGINKNKDLISSLDVDIIHREIHMFLKIIKGVFYAPEKQRRKIK